MSVTRCREINTRLRAAGITVHEWAGWESRGNGQISAYQGGLIHHTGTAYGGAFQALVSGRPDLSGPLCNYAGNENGSITVIAANPANHAGASGGRSMGPLPVTSSFNRTVLGLEIVYPGVSPMRDAQYHAALLWARVVADVVGFGDVERIRAHAETSVTGKWDPGDAPGRTINMSAFRAAARIVGQQEEDMALSDEYIRDPYSGNNELASSMLGYARLDAFYSRLAAERAEVKIDALTGALSDDEANIIAAVRAAVQEIPAGGQVDVRALAAAIASVGTLVARVPDDQIALLVSAVPQATRELLADALAGGTS
jgi:hypothetical protein